VKVRESAPQFRAAALRSQKAEIPLTAFWNYEGAKQCDIVVLELCHAILLECVSDVVCDAGYRVIEASDEVSPRGRRFMECHASASERAMPHQDA
jgi:hypothetical protein